MSLRRLIGSIVAEALLVEGRLDDLQAKHPDVDVAAAAAADPSLTKKYVAWMVKQLAAGAAKEDLFPSIRFFDQHLQKFEKKDVNAYKTAKELEDAVKAAEPKVSASQEKKAAKTDAAKIYEDDRYLVVRPDTHGACVAYGKGTQWCITMETDSYYKDYVEQGYSFYFFVDKDPNALSSISKIAMAVRRNEYEKGLLFKFFDATDNRIPKSVAEGRFPGLVAKALADFKTRPISDETKKLRLVNKALSFEATSADVVAAWPFMSRNEKGRLLDPGATAIGKSKIKLLGVPASELIPLERDPEVLAVLNGQASINYMGVVHHVDAEGRNHRDGDLPAVITNYEKEWWIHGERRREDPSLPVVTYNDGSMDWYKNGKLWRREWPV